MKLLRTSILLLALAVVAASCGSSGSEGGTDGPSQTAGSDGETGADGEVLGTANMGGEVVDPKPHTIDSFVIQESDPESIQIEFTAGAEGCTAADAIATATDTEVVITLVVGITTDALVKSCPAGEFSHQLTIGLDEGLAGRRVVLG